MPVGVTNGQANNTSTVALPVARSLFSADRWDTLLVTGVFMLVFGVGLVVGALMGVVVGVGSALIVSGSLFVLGALNGARNTMAGVID